MHSEFAGQPHHSPSIRRQLRKALRYPGISEPRAVAPSLILAIAITLVVCALLILNDSYRGPDDDFGIATVLSGYYPGSGLCLFTNQLLNNFIIALGAALPQANAFLIAERSSTVLAYFAISYIAFRYLPIPVVASLQSFLVLLIMPECTAAANFTVVAALCCFSGMACLAIGIVAQKRSAVAAGSLLFALGYMWRANVALMATPFTVVCLISAAVVLLSSEAPRARGRKTIVWIGFAIIAMLLCVAVPFAVDQSVADDPEYVAWSDYSNARSGLVDYPVKPYDEIEQELEAIGVSKTDYQCMTNWLTADPDILTTQKMQDTLEIAQENRSGSLAESAASELGSMIDKKRFFICLAVLFAACLLLAPRRQLLFIFVGIAGAFCACTLLRYTGRCPSRVEHAAWLLSAAPAVVAAIDHYRASEKSNSRAAMTRYGIALGLGTVSLIVCVALFSARWIPSFNIDRFDQFAKDSRLAQESELVQHFTSPDDIYIWDPTAFIYPERELKYKNLPPAAFFESNTFAGGWTQGSGFMKRHNEALGVSNPFKSLIDKPNTYFVARSLSRADTLRDYLREHYGASINYEIAETVPLGEDSQLYVLKFSK